MSFFFPPLYPSSSRVSSVDSTIQESDNGSHPGFFYIHGDDSEKIKEELEDVEEMRRNQEQINEFKARKDNKPNPSTKKTKSTPDREAIQKEVLKINQQFFSLHPTTTTTTSDQNDHFFTSQTNEYYNKLYPPSQLFTPDSSSQSPSLCDGHYCIQNGYFYSMDSQETQPFFKATNDSSMKRFLDDRQKSVSFLMDRLNHYNKLYQQISIWGKTLFHCSDLQQEIAEESVAVLSDNLYDYNEHATFPSNKNDQDTYPSNNTEQDTYPSNNKYNNDYNKYNGSYKNDPDIYNDAYKYNGYHKNDQDIYNDAYNNYNASSYQDKKKKKERIFHLHPLLISSSSHFCSIRSSINSQFILYD